VAEQIRFDDGAAYEKTMGVWSRLAGEIFLDWVKPAAGLHWADIGCGNGAFTALIAERCAPAEIQGVDPSEGQIAFARTRAAARAAQFQQGDAMALPFPAHRFDIAVMALVLFFVPDPAKALAEMVRVTRRGGTIAAYLWDMPGGGFPWEPVIAEIRAMQLPIARPPSADISRMDALRRLWTDGGLGEIETREIKVTRGFASFDEFWTIALMGPAISAAVSKVSSADIEQVRAGVHKRVTADAGGRITYAARANAIKGRVPG
jgi:ubiquinone/menaquinone biosynthesis C-methylase UbiE